MGARPAKPKNCGSGQCAPSWGKGISAICWRITPPTTMGCARTLHSTRIRRSIDLRRQSGLSHQSLGSAVSIGTTFGWHNRHIQVFYRRLEASISEESQRFAHQGANEHQMVERQLQKMSVATDKMTDRWTAALKVFGGSRQPSRRRGRRRRVQLRPRGFRRGSARSNGEAVSAAQATAADAGRLI